MCVIIYLPKGKTIDEWELDSAWNYNPDGAGIAYVKNGRVFMSKGYLDFNNFYDSCKDIIFDTSIDRVIHFRFTSKGTTCAAQTHPYPLTDNNTFLSSLSYEGKKPVAMMNGTLNIKVESGLNDTMSWIKKDLYKYKNNIKKLMSKLNKNYCRWAVITTKGIFVTDDFINVNGVYYSNTYHLDYYGRGFKSFKSSWYDDYDLLDWYSDSEYYSDFEECDHCYEWGLDCLGCCEVFEKKAKKNNVLVDVFDE